MPDAGANAEADTDVNADPDHGKAGARPPLTAYFPPTSPAAITRQAGSLLTRPAASR